MRSFNLKECLDGKRMIVREFIFGQEILFKDMYLKAIHIDSGKPVLEISDLTFPLQLDHSLVEVNHYAASFANKEGGM